VTGGEVVLWWRCFGEPWRGKWGSETSLDEGEARKMLDLSSRKKEWWLHRWPASGAAIGGRQGQWMPKMEPTRLFIGKEREDERAKVEDRLAKYCGPKTAVEELLQGVAGGHGLCGRRGANASSQQG
jgi:hypothetical protein